MTQFSDSAWARMDPGMWMARLEARLLVQEMFGEDLVITSGRRKPTVGGSSLHAEGRAMDIRSKHWGPGDQVAFAKTLQARLGEDFFVLVEGPASPDPKYRDRVPHVHVELDPKGRHTE